jgi:hypothetical protein
MPRFLPGQEGRAYGCGFQIHHFQRAQVEREWAEPSVGGCPKTLENDAIEMIVVLVTDNAELNSAQALVAASGVRYKKDMPALSFQQFIVLHKLK